jgi:hypothetical protein
VKTSSISRNSTSSSSALGAAPEIDENKLLFWGKARIYHSKKKEERRNERKTRRFIRVKEEVEFKILLPNKLQRIFQNPIKKLFSTLTRKRIYMRLRLTHFQNNKS